LAQGGQASGLLPNSSERYDGGLSNPTGMRDIGDLLLDDFRRNGEQVKTKQESKSAIIVEISPKQRILNNLIASNPSIGELVSNLNLQIV
jgi:hypothetical protein